MLFQSRSDRVRQIDGPNITLEETLRPLWKLTFYCGVSFDWCSPIICKSKYHIYRFSHYLSIALSFSLLVFLMLFELVQILRQIEKSSSIHGIVLNFMWFVPVPIALITQMNYIFGRKAFLNFFEDWSKIEKDISKTNFECTICDSKSIHWMVYFAYAGMTIASLVALGFEIRNKPEASYVLSTYQIIRETLPLPLVGAIHLLGIFLVWILMSLGDVVPAFVFYHAALSVTCFEKDVKAVFDNKFLATNEKKITSITENVNSSPYTITKDFFQSPLDLDTPIQLLWIRYENLSHMIGRANLLFGTSIVISHGGSILLITALLYSIFYNLEGALKNELTDSLITFIANLVAISFRFVVCTFMSSLLQRSVSKLRTSLNCLLGKYWHQITREDRDLLRSFLSRIQSDTLVASPLGIYNITVSTLLTVLGLVLSYVIVLLQSK